MNAERTAHATIALPKARNLVQLDAQSRKQLSSLVFHAFLH